MKLSGNTILITGGASGIGLAFAENFLKSGNKVIVVGRQENKLAAAKEKFPELHTRVCDVSKEEERIQLYEWVTKSFPDLNVLVNNAGIQQRVNLLDAKNEWHYYQNEIAINVEGPIHLSMLFIPHLRKQKQATILNVTSGLAIQPGVWVPIYSATKAAMHSFTVTLRQQLENTNVEVIEVLPPAVNTDLGGVGVHTFGAPLNDFIHAIFEGLKNGQIEIGYGGTEKRLTASRDELDQGMKKAWHNFLNNNPDFFK
ncbi:SDR family NAD(P)-dependent oxidoreductase [Lysinibacillus telephonicus]|uniref:SDR family NAD(P)-dependent oxidoreductase n=1 Tax=Lysinibacillus telephonicus TaxID=1714840 RepID=A0A3S0JPC1_9BACI|nr:SDR family NAD(P)-dependent oxidoreductase [Lysinibacillus telephonicus]RTQ92742.1 SDR family NAD(P)-dependent oxidoreductase [Lysinibacillus telephonicus]